MKGIGFGGLLAILFIAFKLAGIINWSWLWVLAPLWAGIALVLIIAGLCFLFIGVAEWLDNLKHARRKKKRGLK